MKISDYFDLGNIREIVCTRYHFNLYKVEVIDDKKYLIVKSNPTIETIDDIGIKNIDLLFDTVKLGAKLTVSPLSMFDFERICTENDIELIRKWCEKHGAPFIETIGEIVKSANDIVIDNRKVGFRIGEFYMRIMHICDAYLYWERIYRSDFLTKEENRFHDLDIESAKINLQTSFIAYANVSMTINFDKDEPAFKIIGQDLIDVPMLHLALLITSHMEMKIKKCEFCNELYPAHGRSKYCNNCNRQKAYKTRRKNNPVTNLYDKEYNRLYHLEYNGTISFETYSKLNKALKVKRESLKGLDADKALVELEKWIADQQK